MTPSQPSAARAVEASALPAILMSCLAYFLYSFSDTTIKYLGHHYHFSQIVVFNCVIVASCLAIGGYLREGRKAFRMQKPKWVMLRAFLSVIVAAINVSVVAHLSLTTFYTLVFTSPLWLAVMSGLFLKEKVTAQQGAAVVLGFAVILYIFQPGNGLFNIYGFLTLLSAFTYCCSIIVMRHLGPKESRTMIIISGSAMGFVLMLPIMLFHFQMPGLFDMGVFLAMGLLGAGGVTAITYAFQNAPSASSVAPYHYTQIIWGSILGYVVFGDVPNQRVVIGAVIIIGAGLFLLYGEARTKKRRKSELKKIESIALADIGEPAANPVI